jgi:hypothetical protein
MRPVRQGTNRVAAALCAVGAAALLVSTFLHWYPTVTGAYFDKSTGAPASFAGDVGWLNAWESFAGVDLILAGCMATGLWAAATLLRRGPHRVTGYTAIAAGAIGLALVTWRVVDQPIDFGEGTGVGAGPVLAACALLTVAFGGTLAVVTGRP